MDNLIINKYPLKNCKGQHHARTNSLPKAAQGSCLFRGAAAPRLPRSPAPAPAVSPGGGAGPASARQPCPGPWGAGRQRDRRGARTTCFALGPFSRGGGIPTWAFAVFCELPLTPRTHSAGPAVSSPKVPLTPAAPSDRRWQRPCSSQCLHLRGTRAAGCLTQVTSTRCFQPGTEAAQTRLKHARGSTPAAVPAHERSRQVAPRSTDPLRQGRGGGAQVFPALLGRPPRTAPTARPGVPRARPPHGHWLSLRRQGAAAPLIGRARRPSAPPVNTSPAPVTTERGCGRTSCALPASPGPLLRHRGVPCGHLPPRERAWFLRGKLALPPPCRERSAAGRRLFLCPCDSPALSAPRRSWHRSAGRWQRLPAAGSSRRRAVLLPTPLTVPKRSPSRRRWTLRRQPGAGGGSAAAAFRPWVPRSASPAAAWGQRQRPTPTPACWRQPRPPRGGAASLR